MSLEPVACACCPEPSTADIWEVPVCPAHFDVWGKESPMPIEIEAKARPEHFETVDVGAGPYRRLKAGLLEAYYRKWSAAWALRQRATPGVIVGTGKGSMRRGAA